MARPFASDQEELEFLELKRRRAMAMQPSTVPSLEPVTDPLSPPGSMRLSGPLPSAPEGYSGGILKKGVPMVRGAQPNTAPPLLAMSPEEKQGLQEQNLAAIDREYAPRWNDKVYRNVVQPADRWLGQQIQNADAAIPFQQERQQLGEAISPALEGAGSSLGGMLEGAGQPRFGGAAQELGREAGSFVGGIPGKPLESTAQAAVMANETFNPFAPGSRAFSNYGMAIDAGLRGNWDEVKSLVGEANIDAIWTVVMAIPAARAAKTFKPTPEMPAPPLAAETPQPATSAPAPVVQRPPQPAPFSASPTGPQPGFATVAGRNMDRVVGAMVGAEVGGGNPAFAADDQGGGDNTSGALTGAAIGAIAPRALLRGAQRGGNALTGALAKVRGKSVFDAFNERVAARAVRNTLKSGGIKTAEEAQAAATGRFGDKPSSVADLSQEAVGLTTGLARLPGETGEAAKARYGSLQTERAGRAFSDIEATTGIDPATVTKSLDEAIRDASEEISPAYEQMFAANADVASPRLEELAKDTIVAPYLRRAQTASTSLATTAGQPPSNARTWDLVKRGLDRTISAQMKTGAAAPELMAARNAVRDELDNLIGEYKGLRDNADAPRMRAARTEGKGIFTGRASTVERIKQRATELTGRPLTAFQSGIIEGVVPTVENWRNQLGSLVSAAAEKKFAAAFGESQARELVARIRADLALQQNATRMNPNVGSVTSQAAMGGGVGPLLAETIRAARSPLEAGLAALSKSGAYSRAQRDLMGQMLLEGPTPENLARIYGKRGAPPASQRPPTPTGGGLPPAEVEAARTRRPPQRPIGGGGYKFQRNSALKDTPQEYRDIIMNAPEGHTQAAWDRARKSTSWLPDPSQLRTRISNLEAKAFPSAEDVSTLRAMKEMNARLEGLDYEWQGTGRINPLVTASRPPERMGFGGSPVVPFGGTSRLAENLGRRISEGDITAVEQIRNGLSREEAIALAEKITGQKTRSKPKALEALADHAAGEALFKWRMKEIDRLYPDGSPPQSSPSPMPGDKEPTPVLPFKRPAPERTEFGGGALGGLKQNLALAGVGSVAGSIGDPDNPQRGALTGAGLLLGAKYGGKAIGAIRNATRRTLAGIDAEASIPERAFKTGDGSEWTVSFEPAEDGAIVSFKANDGPAKARNPLTDEYAPRPGDPKQGWAVFRGVWRALREDIEQNSRPSYTLSGRTPAQAQLYKRLAQARPAPDGYRWEIGDKAVRLVREDVDQQGFFGRKPPKPASKSLLPTPDYAEQARVLRKEADQAVKAGDKLKRNTGDPEDLYAYAQRLRAYAEELEGRVPRKPQLEHDPDQYLRDKEAGKITYQGFGGPPKPPGGKTQAPLPTDEAGGSALKGPPPPEPPLGRREPFGPVGQRTGGPTGQAANLALKSKDPKVQARMLEVEPILNSPDKMRGLSETQYRKILDAVEPRLAELEAASREFNRAYPGARFADDLAYHEIVNINDKLADYFRNPDGSRNFEKMFRWSEKNDPSRTMRVEAGRLADDVSGEVPERRVARPPPEPQGPRFGKAPGPAAMGQGANPLTSPRPKQPAPPLSKAAQATKKEVTRTRAAYRAAYNRSFGIQRKVSQDDYLRPYVEAMQDAERKHEAVLANDAKIRAAKARAGDIGSALKRTLTSQDAQGGTLRGGLILGGGAIAGGLGIAGVNALLGPKKSDRSKPPNPRAPDYYWNEIVSKDKATMIQIQEALDKQGYWPRPSRNMPAPPTKNGVYGRTTKAAIRAWRDAHDLDPDEPMTKRDVEKLLAPYGYIDPQDETWRYGDGEKVRLPAY